MPNYTYRVPIHGEAIVIINAKTLAEADQILLEDSDLFEFMADYEHNLEEAQLIGRDNIGDE